jgi:hypothetical protein
MKKMHDEGRCLINTSDQEKEGEKINFCLKEKNFPIEGGGEGSPGGGGGFSDTNAFHKG